MCIFDFRFFFSLLLLQCVKISFSRERAVAIYNLRVFIFSEVAKCRATKKKSKQSIWYKYFYNNNSSMLGKWLFPKSSLYGNLLLNYLSCLWIIYIEFLCKGSVNRLKFISQSVVFRRGYCPLQNFEKAVVKGCIWSFYR